MTIGGPGIPEQTDFTLGYSDQAWNALYIDGLRFERTSVTISGVAGDNKLTVNDGKNVDGATITPHGCSPRKFTVTVVIYSAEMLKTWQDACLYVAATPGKSQPRPVTMIHPQLAMCGLLKTWVDKVHMLQPRGAGIFEAKFDCIEYLPPKPAGKKPPPTAAQIGWGKEKERAAALHALEQQHKAIDRQRDPKTGRHLPYKERKRQHEALDQQATAMGLEPPPSRSSLFP